MAKEIERKYLLKNLPNLPYNRHSSIEQFYIYSTSPEIRLRRYNDDEFMLTIKNSGSLVRDEVEIPVTESFYYDNLAWVGKTPIKKDYYVYEHEGHKIEVSIVDDTFIYAEVEFSSIQEAEEYIFPWEDILIEEITYRPEYKMRNYWVYRHLRQY